MVVQTTSSKKDLFDNLERAIRMLRKGAGAVAGAVAELPDCYGVIITLSHWLYFM